MAALLLFGAAIDGHAETIIFRRAGIAVKQRLDGACRRQKISFVFKQLIFTGLD